MEYLDGELRADDKARLELHISSCDVCRRELAAQQHITRCVQTLEQVPAPPDLARNVAAKIARENSQPVRVGRWLRRYGAMAASIAIVFGLYAALNKHYRPDATAPSAEEDLHLAMEEEATARRELAKADQRPAAEAADRLQLDEKAAALAGVPAAAEAKEAKASPAGKVIIFPDAAPEPASDIVLESENVQQCLADLQAFLEQNGYSVTGRVVADRTVVVAQTAEAPPPAPEKDPGEPVDIIARIAASGKFIIVDPHIGLDRKSVAAMVDAAPGAAMTPPAPAALAQRTAARIGLRQITIMIVNPREARAMQAPADSQKHRVEDAERKAAD